MAPPAFTGTGIGLPRRGGADRWGRGVSGEDAPLGPERFCCADEVGLDSPPHPLSVAVKSTSTSATDAVQIPLSAPAITLYPARTLALIK